jgi:hypothetical protein
LFGFGGQDSRDCLFVGFLFRSLGKPADEFPIANGLLVFQKGQEGVDLIRRQSVDDLVKSFQVAHDSLAGGILSGFSISCRPNRFSVDSILGESPYRPTVNRSARIGGSPASRIFLCAAATS